jgi:hypothetical protein
MRKLIVTLVLIASNSVMAYQFTDDFNLGIYWADLPIRVTKVATQASEGNLLNDVVARAENEWESVVGLEIWDVESGYTNDTSIARNTIRWSTNFGAETGFSPETTLAVTIRHRRGTYFEYFEIILNSENPLLKSNTNDMLYKTMIHELGHIVGIGHSERSPAVMEPTLIGYSRLQSDDQQAILALHSETQRRQDVGFVSALAKTQDNETNALACGSVNFNEPPKGGPLQIALGFVLTLVMLGRKNLPSLS